MRRLDEHAARAAGRIKDRSVEGLDDLHHEADNRARREKLSAALSFRECKFAEEIFIDLAEHIAGGVFGNVGEIFEQLFGNRDLPACGRA